MSQSAMLSLQSLDTLEISFEKYSHSLSHFEDPAVYDHVKGKKLDLVVQKEIVNGKDGASQHDVMLRVNIDGKEFDVVNLTTILEQTRQRFKHSEQNAKIVARPPLWMAISFRETQMMMRRMQFKFASLRDYQRIWNVFHAMEFTILRSSRTSAKGSNPSATTNPVPILSSPSSNRSAATTTTLLAQSSRETSALHSIMGTSAHAQSTQVVDAPRASAELMIGSHHFTNPEHQAPILPITADLRLPNKTPPELFSRANHSAVSRQDAQMHHPTQSQLVIPTSSADHVSRGRASVNEFSNMMEDLKSRYASTSNLFASTIAIGAITRPYTTTEVQNQRFAPTMRPASAPMPGGASQDILIPPRRASPSTLIKARSRATVTVLPAPRETLPRNDMRSPTEANSRCFQVSKASPIVPPARKSSSIDNSTGMIVQSPPNRTDGGIRKVQASAVAAEALIPIQEEMLSPLAATSANRKRPSSSTTVLEPEELLDNKRSASLQLWKGLNKSRMIGSGVQVTRSSYRGSSSALAKSHTAASGLAMHPHKLETQAEIIDAYVSRFKGTRREVLNTPEYQSAATQEERDRLFDKFTRDNLMDKNFVEMAGDFERQYKRIGLEAHRE